ncbi:MAG: hypothetical protein KKF89_05370, partial [Nanoarchaeota archaeon]|nr:hypothetical protein [Nanoarchaeota archaeon]
KEIGLDANIISELIAGSLERYGSARFKGIGHKAMSDVINAGAIGVEIIISGKIPGSRAKNWRFYKGYLKKCGDISVDGVLKSISIAKLKTGIVGIRVSIMPSTLRLPDDIRLNPKLQEVEEEIKSEDVKEVIEEIEKIVVEKISEVKKEENNNEEIVEQKEDVKQEFEINDSKKAKENKKLTKKKTLKNNTK